MSNHITIHVDRTHAMQPSRTGLNENYFEKWHAAQEEIIRLRREIFALKRSAAAERQLMGRLVQMGRFQEPETSRPLIDVSPCASAVSAGPIESPV